MPKLGPATLEDVRIIFRNFEGKEGQYNRAGDRNFAVVLTKEMAEAMMEDGWNVKFPKARPDIDPEEDTRDPYLQVTVGYKGRPPRIVTITSRGRTELSEENVEILDWVDIAKVDLVIRPYEWEVNGRSGVKAYLKSMYVTIDEDDLDRKYADVPDADLEEDPPF